MSDRRGISKNKKLVSVVVWELRGQRTGPLFIMLFPFELDQWEWTWFTAMKQLNQGFLAWGQLLQVYARVLRGIQRSRTTGVYTLPSYGEDVEASLFAPSTYFLALLFHFLKNIPYQPETWASSRPSHRPSCALSHRCCCHDYFSRPTIFEPSS